MTPPMGFNTGNEAEKEISIAEIRPAAALVDATVPEGAAISRAADYAYRIAAVTAGLILLATVM